MIVSFSGGRTSAYMAWKLKELGHDIKCVFMNTGAEHENTLDFIHECDQRWGLNLVWLEVVVQHGERVGSNYKVVSYETAARKGEPFKEICKKYGIPNSSYPHCNRELKLAPYIKWKADNYPEENTAIGIRLDEIDRMSAYAKRDKLTYPLVGLIPTTKAEVLHWWSKQNFNLDLPEHYGNCVTCWKKSDRKLKTVALEQPERFDLFKELERDFSDSGQENNSGKFFRKHRTSADIIASSRDSFEIFRDRLFKQESDAPMGCGETCDLFSS